MVDAVETKIPAVNYRDRWDNPVRTDYGKNFPLDISIMQFTPNGSLHRVRGRVDNGDCGIPFTLEGENILGAFGENLDVDIVDSFIVSVLLVEDSPVEIIDNEDIRTKYSLTLGPLTADNIQRPLFSDLFLGPEFLESDNRYGAMILRIKSEWYPEERSARLAKKIFNFLEPADSIPSTWTIYPGQTIRVDTSGNFVTLTPGADRLIWSKIRANEEKIVYILDTEDAMHSVDDVLAKLEKESDGLGWITEWKLYEDGVPTEFLQEMVDELQSTPQGRFDLKRVEGYPLKEEHSYNDYEWQYLAARTIARTAQVLKYFTPEEYDITDPDFATKHPGEDQRELYLKAADKMRELVQLYTNPRNQKEIDVFGIPIGDPGMDYALRGASSDTVQYPVGNISGLCWAAASGFAAQTAVIVDQLDELSTDFSRKEMQHHIARIEVHEQGHRMIRNVMNLTPLPRRSNYSEALNVLYADVIPHFIRKDGAQGWESILYPLSIEEFALQIMNDLAILRDNILGGKSYYFEDNENLPDVIVEIKDDDDFWACVLGSCLTGISKGAYRFQNRNLVGIEDLLSVVEGAINIQQVLKEGPALADEGYSAKLKEEHKSFDSDDWRDEYEKDIQKRIQARKKVEADLTRLVLEAEKQFP